MGVGFPVPSTLEASFLTTESAFDSLSLCLLCLSPATIPGHGLPQPPASSVAFEGYSHGKKRWTVPVTHAVLPV